MRNVLLSLLVSAALMSCNSGTTTTYNTSGPYSYGVTSISATGCLSQNSNVTVTMTVDNVNPSAYLEASYNNLPSTVQIAYNGNCNGSSTSNNPTCTATFSTTSSISVESAITASFRLNSSSGASGMLASSVVSVCN